MTASSTPAGTLAAGSSEPRFRPGDRAPLFVARNAAGAPYRSESALGRHVVLMFFGRAGDPAGQAALDDIRSHRALFDDRRVCFIGVGTGSADTAGAPGDDLPGMRIVWDGGEAISRAFGAVPDISEIGGSDTVRRHSLLLDPRFRVILTLDMTGRDHVDRIIRHLERLPPHDLFGDAPLWAPVLLVPRLLEPCICRALIKLQGPDARDPSPQAGSDSDTAGDPVFTPEALLSEVRKRLARRLKPEVAKAFQYAASRLEIHALRAHRPGQESMPPARDNAGGPAARRRFSVVVSLNADDYEGGDLRFPEFGRRTYRAGTGAALVFSSSLHHEVTPVTGGCRYALLGFLLDSAEDGGPPDSGSTDDGGPAPDR